METICAVCGFTYGSHLGNRVKMTEEEGFHPNEQCPMAEDSDEWSTTDMSTFKAEDKIC
jgi:hypothetical protein